MADFSPRPLVNVAAGDAHLGRILRKARHLKALEARLAQVLPPELAAHVRVADVRGDVLILGARSNAAASRLRYAGPDILKALAPDCRKPPRRVQVRVLKAPPTPPPSPPARPEAADGAAIEQAARGLSDPELRATMERLARRSRSRKG